MIGKKLIAEGKPVDADKLADTAIAIKTLA